MAKDTLTITDNRTGKSYEVPVSEGTVRAMDLRQIKMTDDEFGLMTYDPAFMNTAACRSAITYIDGDKGILRYRGYPIEELAEQSTFLEVAYLLCEGELPTRSQLDTWNEQIKYHTYVHTNIIKFLEGFRYDAHPMGMLLGVVGALVHILPRRQGHPRSGQPVPPAASDYWRRRRPSPRSPSATREGCRSSSPKRPRLHRQLREHDVQHRRPPPAQEGAATGARDSADPPCRSRAELLDQRGPGRRLLARRPLLGDLRRDRGAVRSAARRRQRSRAAHARRDRGQEEHSPVHRGGEGRPRAG